MNLGSAIRIYGYGTPEGTRKAWDTRGRGRKTYIELKELQPNRHYVQGGQAEQKLKEMVETASQKTPIESQYKEIMIGQFNKIARDGFDERLLSKPIAELSVPVQEAGAYTAGGYNSLTHELFLSSDQLEHRPDSILHEFAHHLDDMWIQVPRLGKAAIQEMKEMMLAPHPRPYPEKDQGFDVEKAKLDRDEMIEEYERAKAPLNSVLSRVGVPKWGGDIDSIRWMDAAEVGLAMATHSINSQDRYTRNAPSLYGMSNGKEWFAESFIRYYQSTAAREHLKRIAPKTYQMIDNLVNGRYWRDTNEA